ncbi:hypothetical protein [Anthocerotibacter panamensis]|uniref:hypothetical protein n=1 Tax=Anthocerotibacter panamensis TaxID=2857077 RepID=UPI001C403D97|nr:hypothetical protein [Anthocerotibacter panamensis]
MITIESDISVPDAPVHGRAIGIDLGLERFLSAADGSFQQRPKFFKSMHLKTAHKLCDQAQTIFAQDLNVRGLTRGMLRKDFVDAAFEQFLSLTQGVCWQRGVYFAAEYSPCPGMFLKVRNRYP